MFYGYLLYAFLSDSLWRIGYSVRQDQVQGTLEGLYLHARAQICQPRIARCAAVRADGSAQHGAGGGQLDLWRTAAPTGIGSGRVFVHSRRDLWLGFCFAAYTLVAGEAASSTVTC